MKSKHFSCFYLLSTGGVISEGVMWCCTEALGAASNAIAPGVNKVSKTGHLVA